MHSWAPMSAGDRGSRTLKEAVNEAAARLGGERPDDH
jgi:hypothetical protein